MVHTGSGHGGVFGMQEVSGRRSIMGEGVTVEVQQACKVVNMRACRSRASSGEQGQPKASFHCDGASEQAQCKYLYLNPEDQEKEAEQEQEQE